MDNALSEKRTCIPNGIRYVAVHKKDEDEYKFTLGAAIVKHKDIWVVSYLQSFEKENDSKSRIVCRYSFDDCKTWSEVNVVADADESFARSHGVFYSDGDSLWIFCPKARFDSTSDFRNMDFVMESYLFNEKELCWSFDGIRSSDEFWPLCEPLRLKNGSVLVAGLECKGTHEPAVAISNGGIDSFKMICLPNKSGISTWGETTVVENADELIAYVRSNSDRKVFTSKSLDFGITWSDMEKTDIEAIPSKLYAGVLSDGRRYLIRNIDTLENGEKSNQRKTLSISFFEGDKNALGREYIVRNGFEEEKYRYAPQWSYPYAVEENGFLYVVYTKHKWENELAIIPIESFI